MQTVSSEITVESVLNTPWPFPLWATLVVGAALLVFVGGLYGSERGLATRGIRSLLTLLRLSLLALVCWMLAGWSFQRFKSDRPELVIVVDRSVSMDTRDEVFGSKKQTRFEFAQKLFADLDRRKRDSLNERYDLKWFTLAEQLEAQSIDLLTEKNPLQNATATGVQSRIGDGLSRLIDRQAGRGTAAVVFISDGITTSGVAMSEAAQKARRAAIPFHTLVVGQQFVQPDVRLVDLLIDREVYLGDQVTAEVSVVASDIATATTKLSLVDRSTGQTLDATTIELNPNKNQQQVRLSFVPERSGEIPLELQIEAVEGETDTDNNALQAAVMVQDKSIKVLMVFPTASYEFRFLKNLLERTQQDGATKSASFELQSVLQNADASYVEQDASSLRLVPSSASALGEFDVFVLGEPNPELISRSAQQGIFDAVTSGGSGCIFIYGSAAPSINFSAWPIGKLLPLDTATNSNALARLANGTFQWEPTSLGATALPMQLASSTAGSLEVWNRLPRASRVVQAAGVRPGAQTLVNAVDDLDGGEAPMIVTQFAGAGRTAFQASDETYRWTSYAGSDLYYQRYWGQMLRWLSRGKLNRSSEQSVLSVEPKQSRLGHPLRIQLTLGSESSRGEIPASVDVVIESEQGFRRQLSLTRSDAETATYQSTVNDLGPGAYRAVMLRPVEATPPAAAFVITAPPGEQANLRADQEAMQYLAEHTRGRSYTSKGAKQLLDRLPLGKPTRLGTLPPIPFWNSHWIAALFVTLITCEWLLRRRARML